VTPLIEPETLLRRIARYMRVRQLRSFRLVLQHTEGDPEVVSYLDRLFSEIARLADLGLSIEICLRSDEPGAFDRPILNRLGQLGGALFIELPERLRGRAGDAQAARWIRRLQETSRASLGTVPVQIHAMASPAIAPLAYLRWLEGLQCDSVDVLWPRHFSWDFPPWSSRFDVSQAEYQQSPIYGQWFADLFRLWWVLDNPNLQIEGFARCVDSHAGDAPEATSGSRESFIVARDGELRLPRRERDLSAVGSLGTGLHIQAIDVVTLERLREDQRRQRPWRDVMLTDWVYFSEQVGQVLSSDCYAELLPGEGGVRPGLLGGRLTALHRN
jgi:hypothetical protein